MFALHNVSQEGKFSEALQILCSSEGQRGVPGWEKGCEITEAKDFTKLRKMK